MPTKTRFLTILILVLFSISCCNGDTCYCTCCAGNYCKPTLQGTIPVSSCASSSCESVCQNKYPLTCTDGAGSTVYQCKQGSASTPNWSGVFSMANRCDTRTCCCPVGQMSLTHVGVNALRVQCIFSGQCPPGGTSLDDTIDMPTGFSVQILFMNNPILVTLSDDSRTIQFYNPGFPSCSEVGTKNGALLSTGTLNLAFVFLFSGIMTFKQSIV